MLAICPAPYKPPEFLVRPSTTLPIGVKTNIAFLNSTIKVSRAVEQPSKICDYTAVFTRRKALVGILRISWRLVMAFVSC